MTKVSFMNDVTIKCQQHLLNIPLEDVNNYSDIFRNNGQWLRTYVEKNSYQKFLLVANAHMEEIHLHVQK